MVMGRGEGGRESGGELEEKEETGKTKKQEKVSRRRVAAESAKLEYVAGVTAPYDDDNTKKKKHKQRQSSEKEKQKQKEK